MKPVKDSIGLYTIIIVAMAIVGAVILSQLDILVNNLVLLV